METTSFKADDASSNLMKMFGQILKLIFSLGGREGGGKVNSCAAQCDPPFVLDFIHGIDFK